MPSWAVTLPRVFKEGLMTMTARMPRRHIVAAAVAAALFAAPSAGSAADIKEIRIDFATYNPVSLVLKERGLLEKAFEKDGIKIRWVQTVGSNKALEFLNARSIDFGS